MRTREELMAVVEQTAPASVNDREAADTLFWARWDANYAGFDDVVDAADAKITRWGFVYGPIGAQQGRPA